MRFFSVSEAADDVGCLPRDISDAFYARRLDESCILRVANRRVIPEAYMPEVRRVISELGKVRQDV